MHALEDLDIIDQNTLWFYWPHLLDGLHCRRLTSCSFALSGRNRYVNTTVVSIAFSNFLLRHPQLRTLSNDVPFAPSPTLSQPEVMPHLHTYRGCFADVMSLLQQSHRTLESVGVMYDAGTRLDQTMVLSNPQDISLSSLSISFRFPEVSVLEICMPNWAHQCHLAICPYAYSST